MISATVSQRSRRWLSSSRSLSLCESSTFMFSGIANLLTGRSCHGFEHKSA